MKEQFKEIEIEIVTLSETDVIFTSGEGDDGGTTLPEIPIM